MGSDRICSVLSRARRSGVTSASDTPAGSTNLKRDLGNTKDSLCDWIQLKGVDIVLLVFVWEN